MSRLFVSYRRSDTGAYADRLARCLAAFQFDAVFLDRTSIELGDDFPARIRNAMLRCEIVLVLIGKEWLSATTESGQRRIADPDDWVRKEVALALLAGGPVVPVFFDGASMPDADELPDELKELAERQGYDVNGDYFDRDASDLGKKLEALLTGSFGTAQGRIRPEVSSGLPGQLRIIWIGLSLVTLFLAIAPYFVPPLPPTFWFFPATLTVAAFCWWAYWLGESYRPVRG